VREVVLMEVNVLMELVTALLVLRERIVKWNLV